MNGPLPEIRVFETPGIGYEESETASAPAWSRFGKTEEGIMGIEDSMRKAADEVAGRAKEMWGDATDNERLEAEGRAQHRSDDAGHAHHDLDDTSVDHPDHTAAGDLRSHRGDDGPLRDALRDDMGQDNVRDVLPDTATATPGDDGTLRDSLRDDMGQDRYHDPATADLRDTPRRDQI